MLAWSIETALESGCFDHVVVSTDDDEIAAIATAWGAEVPFMRPAALADDFSGTTPVVVHGIEALRDLGWSIDHVCCLYATAPLLTAEILRSGLDRLAANPQKKFAFSVASFAFPVQRAIRMMSDGLGVEPMNPELIGCRSQDLEEAYHDAGQFYWGTKDAWLNHEGMFKSHSIPVVVPRYRVQDIDTEEDWMTAEFYCRLMRGDA